MYSLLEGVRVLEVALLGTDTAGQHLADLGADVIKVEGPPHGDYIRSLGSVFVDGVNVMHHRWNRGKRSVWLDLKTEVGKSLFLALAESSTVVIDGLRCGALERLGLGEGRLKEINPTLVYCAFSGLGCSGPYKTLATHGVFYDAFAGLAVASYAKGDGIPRIPAHYTPVGVNAGGLYAALAILAALTSATRTGTGTLVEVTEADSAVAWEPDLADARLNGVEPVRTRSMEDSVRYSFYRTKGEGTIVFQATEEKFWDNFCHAIDRPDLLVRFPSTALSDHASGNEELRRELQDTFLLRSAEEWTTLFIEANVPGGPVYSDGGFIDDPQFQARGLAYDVTTANGEHRTFVGTPIKVADEEFGTSAAPAPGQHTAEVLREVLKLDEDAVQTYLASCPASAR
jgi:crotonobetainyl-CoA:carnitine CoA-transferase CaiB-like acyl-CoA transferase